MDRQTTNGTAISPGVATTDSLPGISDRPPLFHPLEIVPSTALTTLFDAPGPPSRNDLRELYEDVIRGLENAFATTNLSIEEAYCRCQHEFLRLRSGKIESLEESFKALQRLV